MYLIEAIPSIIKHVNLNFLIVGKFWEREEKYRERIRDLGIENNIKIVNKYVPDEEIQLYFAAADLVVLPYISATGGGIVQTAYSFNKPVVATNVGCFGEVVDDRQNGYLVPPRTPQGIADAVISFYVEKKEQFLARNIIKQRKKFSWDRMVETIESFDGLWQ
jgi:glycosyltransferase involved in cell wall biosynthesis